MLKVEKSIIKNEEYKHLIVLGSCILLVLVQIFLFCFVLNYSYENYTEAPFFRKQTIANVGIYLFFLVALTRATGGYKVGYLRINEVCIAQVISIVMTNVLEYFQLCLFFGKFIFRMPLFMLTLVEIPIAIIWAYVVRRNYLAMYPARQMLLLYGDRVQNELINQFSNRKDKYIIEESYCIKDKNLEDIYEHISSYQSVVIADISTEYRNDILKYCYGKGIRTYTTPKISDILLGGEQKIHLFETPLLLGRNYGLTMEQRLIKRIFDIIVGCFLLLVVSPLFAIISALILIFESSPVFFVQNRVGRNEKQFKVYKFRSMKVYRGVEENRATPFGNFLRRTHLDELPQILNVIKGDMSLVGPRPLVSSDYDNNIPEFVYRLKVKPGITGYAQVYGSHVISEYDKLKLDLFYISNYSIILDIKLLLMTFQNVFKFDNREEIEHSKK